ncbi:hypothetical protein MRS44_013571 [Fusarium solani]|uniref:2EXR domain-containing protein n=1 Tax=Fusarium solani TaxID=169388 RepID=A0A9P9G1Y3_FUSSL|nr:uncharacterized protein B0J15DRAFT_599824 [Fusarium solani]KAH7229959.1 hypothetical protein B0J15DRAFT_599824 [Fusarium solani]KAJ3454971.1 hypothetical protein MRS44_013571 [Fusarium solani]
MASNYVHNHGFSPAGVIDAENEESNTDARGTRDKAISCFPHFCRLPVEVRLMIWKTAFDAVDPAVVVCSFSEGRHRASVNHRHAKASRLPPVALVCREARREWVQCTRSSRSPSWLPERVYVPRTVFLVPAATVVGSRLRGLSLSIAHIAIDIADSPDVFLIFEALARFPRLKTIIIVVPSGAVDETQVVEWQQRLREDSHTLQKIGALVDGPSSDGEWHKGTYLGWLLRNYLQGPQVKAFYSRDNSPRVKLYIDRSGWSQTTEENLEQSWSLFLY